SLIPYVRYQNLAGVEFRADGYRPVELNRWEYLGGRLGHDERLTGRQLALFHDLQKVTRDVTDVVNANGRPYGDLIIASNLVGDIDEVRIWSRDLIDEVIAGRRGKALVFGNDAALLGSLQPNNGLLERTTTDDITLNTWTIEAWVRAVGPGLIMERRAGASPHDNEILFNYRMAIAGDGTVEARYDFFARITPDPTDHRLPPLGPAMDRWGTININSASAITDGEWHHVAFSFNGAQATVFVDGVAENSRAFFPAINTVFWHLAQGDPTPVEYCFLISTWAALFR
ncbi:MAG: LamG-like jellyroll fold domain-containing protein, partial [Verrucomicrobiota bacterium]